MKNILVSFVLLISFLNNAQEKKSTLKKIKLEEIVKQLENKFEIRFSFNNDILDEKTVSIHENTPFQDILNQIKEQTNLDFVFIDDKNIIIKKTAEEEPKYTIINLENINIISEYLTPGFDQNQQDGSITLQPSKLEILPGLIEPDVMQSLQLLPGISSPTESATNLHFRGGTPDQNLILWDGIKMYHQGHFFGMISAFNPYITDKVNLYRSGTSSKYGERISGVIDLHTDETVPSKTAMGFGTNLLHTDFFIKTPLEKDKFGLIISARRSFSDLFNTETFNKVSNKVFQNTKIVNNNQNIEEEEELTIIKNKFYFTDFNSKAIWNISNKNKITFSSLFVKNKLDYINSDSENTRTQDILNLENNGFSLNWKSVINYKWQIESDIHYSKYKSFYNNKEEYLDISDNNYYYNKANIIDDFGLLLHNNYTIDTNNTVTFGYDFTKYDVAFNLSYFDDEATEENQMEKLNTHSFYFEHQYKNKKWYTRTGIRNSYFSNNCKIYLEPRIYIDFELNSLLKIKASGEIKNQAISQLVSFEFNYLGLDDAIWVLTNNDDIPVLNNKQLTTGILFNKKGWKIDIEAYYKRTEGLTTLTKGFNSTVRDDYASGFSDAFGIDFLIKKRIKNFRTWLSYSLSRTSFTFNEIQNNSFAGNFDQRHVLTFSNTYKYNNFQFSLGWHFATGKPYSEPTLESTIDSNGDMNYDINFQSQNNKRLPNYHKLDASIIYDFSLSKNVNAKIGASIINLYNQRNIIDKLFQIEEGLDNSELIQQTVVGLEITPNFVFRVHF